MAIAAKEAVLNRSLFLNKCSIRVDRGERGISHLFKDSSTRALLSEAESRVTALAILDRICGPFRGYEAEFDAESANKVGFHHPDFDDDRDPHQSSALGMLMIEAFAPNGCADLARYSPMLNKSGAPEAILAADAAGDLWYDEVCNPFSTRYELY